MSDSTPAAAAPTTAPPSSSAPAPAAAPAPALPPASAAPATSSTEALAPTVDGPGNLIADAPPPNAESAAEPTAPDPNAPAPIFPDFPTLKLPEGIDGKAPETAAFIASFKDAGLSGDQAQKLVDQYAGKLVPIETLQQQLDAPNQLWKDTQKQWQDTVKADPEVGGSKLTANLASIAKVIDSIGGKDAKDIREAFNFTGAGNNPQIVRFLHRIAATLNVEGRTVAAGGVAQMNFKTAAERIYPGATKDAP